MAVASPRMLFIGLDSADPFLIRKWCDEGSLPNLSALVDRSRQEAVTTPKGFGNSVFWSSFFTGFDPSNTAHYYYRQIEPGSYRTSYFREDTDYRRKPIWKLVSENGGKVAVVDMVRAPLAQNINGIQVADWLAHDITGSPRSWPNGLISDLTDKYGHDPMGGNADLSFATTTDKAEFYQRLRERIKTKTNVALDLLMRGDWDLFMTAFGESHDVGHTSWHLHDPSHPKYEEALALRLGDPIEDIYRSLDEAVGRLIDAVGDHTTIVVLAGPGMGPNYTGNHLLDRILLRLEPKTALNPTRMLPSVQSAYRFLLPISLRSRLRSLAISVEDSLLASERGRGHCFAVPHNDNSGAIRINLVGREPAGVVQPGQDYEDYCKQLSKSLMTLVNADTGLPVVDEVVRIDREFHGECIDHLPDLLVVWNRASEIEGVRSKEIGELRAKFDGSRTGDHTPHGLVLVCGPGIEPAALVDTLSVMDVGATLSAMLGVSIPGADGQNVAGLNWRAQPGIDTAI